MAEKELINVKSLKEQIYEYFRLQLSRGEIRPGSLVNLDATSRKLGISKTPLREALIMLEMEGFVTILPRKGVYVNELTLQDIREYYQIIGAMESVALLDCQHKLKESHIQRMRELNRAMKAAIGREDFNEYYARNLDFHNTFLELSGNKTSLKIINTLKKRLYDFPRREGYVKKWEEESIREHEKILNAIEEGNFIEAARCIRDIHWSFSVQERFIREYYECQQNMRSSLPAKE